MLRLLLVATVPCGAAFEYFQRGRRSTSAFEDMARSKAAPHFVEVLDSGSPPSATLSVLEGVTGDSNVTSSVTHESSFLYVPGDVQVGPR